jgi:hypothetical protein
MFSSNILISFSIYFIQKLPDVGVKFFLTPHLSFDINPVILFETLTSGLYLISSINNLMAHRIKQN